MKCPFLSGVPAAAAQLLLGSGGAGSGLMKLACDYCPVMSQLRGFASALSHGPPALTATAPHPPQTRAASATAGAAHDVIVERGDKIYAAHGLSDVVEGAPYGYESFLSGQIEKKKSDHSYRVFKRVNRDARHFPYAEEYTRDRKRIMVWCSNDYLGMSTHPLVRQAIIGAHPRHDGPVCEGPAPGLDTGRTAAPHQCAVPEPVPLLPPAGDVRHAGGPGAPAVSGRRPGVSSGGPPNRRRLGISGHPPAHSCSTKEQIQRRCVCSFVGQLGACLITSYNNLCCVHFYV